MKKHQMLISVILGAFIINQTHANEYHKPPIITVMGTGYVGLITGACLAEFGNQVICVDTDQHKINSLNHGIIPIYEPGLDELVKRNAKTKRLTFTTQIAQAIKEADIIFIAVGTPMGVNGCADLTAFKKAFHSIIPHLTTYKLICVKSTVPVGCCANLVQELQDQGINPNLYDIVSNPEFLREGSAIADFMKPDRIIVGSVTTNAQILMQQLYAPLINNNVPCFFTSLSSAEMIKYAANAFLATKLSFINEIANLCDCTGADIIDVAHGIGSDPRISYHFLKPGPGFGGSCFPKDCAALCAIADNRGAQLNLVKTALEINDQQKKKATEKLAKLIGDDLTGKTIAVLGLAFKNNTDDIRYSPAITTIEILLQKGAQVIAYDPAATENMRLLFPNILYTSNPYQAATNADALIIITEWEEFKNLDLEQLATIMKSPIVVDMRNLLNPKELQRHHFTYAMIGRS